MLNEAKISSAAELRVLLSNPKITNVGELRSLLAEPKIADAAQLCGIGVRALFTRQALRKSQ